jgi:hypothetical protein
VGCPTPRSIRSLLIVTSGREWPPGVDKVVAVAKIASCHRCDTMAAWTTAGKLAPLGPELQASVRKLYDEQSPRSVVAIPRNGGKSRLTPQ